MLTRISNLRSISADSSVSSNDVRKIIFPTGSLTNNGSGTITLAFSGDGSSFTNLNAGNLASGTLADARLSSNIPLKNAANTFTNANTVAVSSPAMVNLILQGAASQASDLMQFQNSNGTVLSSFDKSGNLGLGVSGSPLGRLHIKGIVQTMYVGDNASTSAVYAQFQNLGGRYYMGVDNSTGTALWTGGIAYASSFGSANGTPLQLATNNTVRITINQSGNVLINGFGSSVIGMTVKGAVSQTADLFQTQDSNGNILNSFTASGQQSFYGLSSTTNRIQSAIQSSFANSTDATRAGQLNFGTYYTTTFQTGISIVSNSVSVQLGFYGATPISRPTASLVTTGYTAGASTTMTIDGKSTGDVGSTAYTFGDLVAILKNLGLLAS